MFDNFMRAFGEDPLPGDGPETADAFMSALGGRTFGSGLMFAIAKDDVPMWRENLGVAFGARADGFVPFAYDWIGDCFAADADDVRIYDIGSGEVLSVGLPVDHFLNQGVPAAHDKVLLSSFWVEWLKAGGARPAYNQCIGYKVPLFLNGQQDVSSLELSGLDVYWYMTGQILQQVQG